MPESWRSPGAARVALLLLLLLPALAGCVAGPARPGTQQPSPPLPGPVPQWAATMPGRGLPGLRASPDGSVLVAATSRYSDGVNTVTLRAFDAGSGAPVLGYAYPYKLCCHFPPLASSDAAGRLLAPGDNVSVLARDGSVLRSVGLSRDPGGLGQELPVSAELSRDGRVAAWTTWPAGRLYVARGGALWTALLGAGDAFPALAMTPDGAWVAAATPHRLSLFRSHASTEVRSWALSDGTRASDDLQGVAMDDSARLLATFRFTDDGDMTLLLLHADREAPVAGIALGPGTWGVAYVATDASWVAVGSVGHHAWLFDADGRQLADFGPGAELVDARHIGGRDLLLVKAEGSLDVYEATARGASLLHRVAAPVSWRYALLPGGFATVEQPQAGNVSTLRRYGWPAGLGLP